MIRAILAYVVVLVLIGLGVLLVCTLPPSGWWMLLGGLIAARALLGLDPV